MIATYIQRREGYDIKAPTQQEDGMETDSPGPSSLPQQEEEPENGEQVGTEHLFHQQVHSAHVQ